MNTTGSERKNTRPSSGSLFIAAIASVAIVVGVVVALAVWRSRARAADLAYYQSQYTATWDLPASRLQTAGCSEADAVVNQIKTMDFVPDIGAAASNMVIELAEGQALRVICNENYFAVQAVVLIRDRRHPENAVGYSAYHVLHAGISTDSVMDVMQSVIQEIDAQAKAYWSEISKAALRRFDT